MPFAARTTSRSTLIVFASKFISTYQTLLHPDCSCCRDKVSRAAGQRTWCHGFCKCQLDNFTVTRQPSSTYRDLVPLKQITVTRYFQQLTGICKNHATAKQTPTKLNRRAVRFIAADPDTVYIREFIVTQKFHSFIGTHSSRQFFHIIAACHPDNKLLHVGQLASLYSYHLAGLKTTAPNNKTNFIFA